jgi:hypothetical protein
VLQGAAMALLVLSIVPAARAKGSSNAGSTRARRACVDATCAEDVSPSVQEQLDEMRRIIERQNRRIEQLESERGEAVQPAERPEVEPQPVEENVVEVAAPAPEPTPDRGFDFGYDKGFYIRGRDLSTVPFSLSINGRMQLRYTNFSRDHKTWTDNAGVTRKIDNRNDFEIERGRLEFTGTALYPELGYYINLDADTDDNHSVIFHDFWISYAFHRAFVLYGGKAFVPGSRDWLNGSTRTRFADRSLTTSFFRPDRTLGLWVIGEPLDGVYYRTMLGNGFATTDLDPGEIDDQFATATSLWWDVFDNYGKGASDLEWHDRPGLQIGSSFTFAPTNDENDEENFLRLSDGTRIIDEGALAPDTTVDRFKVYLYSVDAAAKWHGFSLNGEYFFRWVHDIRATGPIPKRKMFDHGFFLEAGYFLIRNYLELNARTSQIFGDFGDSSEYAGGINWFINGTHGLKLAIDATKVNDSPISNSGPNYRAGDDGVMVRTQLQTAF